VIAAMKVTVVRPDELGAGEEKLWHEFQNSSPGTAYPALSLPYARMLCRADENGRVAVVEDGGEIRAFLPYTTGSGGIAGTLGGEQTAVDGIVSSGDRIDLRAVVRGAKLRGWRFSRAPVEQRALDPYRYQGSHHAGTISIADLRGGYDAYQRELPQGGRKEISRAAKRRRALEREVGEVSFEWNSRDPSHLDWLLNRKSDQYVGFRNWLQTPANRTLVYEIADSDHEDCSGVTSVLHAGGKPLAATFSMRRGHILDGWLTSYDPEYSRFSPGTISWLALIVESAKRGADIVDFGYGDNQSKRRFANAAYSVSGGGVWASRIGGTARSLYRKVRFRDMERQA
jgi:CelD/BcsL family acetyltransferase involved in cellulose biosynthesis